MQIDISNYDYPNFFECREQLCPFRRECAQHETAGDFRTEGGFTPELLIIGNACYCDTCHEEPLDFEGYQRDYPANYDKLGSGALHSNSIGQLVTESYDNEGLYDYYY